MGPKIREQGDVVSIKLPTSRAVADQKNKNLNVATEARQYEYKTPYVPCEEQVGPMRPMLGVTPHAYERPLFLPSIEVYP